MKAIDRILDMVKENNGIVKTSQVTKAGISREYLSILVEKGLLERSGRGVYITPFVFDDKMLNLQTRHRRGIFSHETALFLLDLSDQTPIRYSMTFPLSYNTSNLKTQNINYYRVKEEFYGVGIITVNSPNGNEISIYNAERTLCDIVRGRSNTDIQIVTEAYKHYAMSNQKNIPLLSKYAKQFKVDKKVRNYLEVLL